MASRSRYPPYGNGNMYGNRDFAEQDRKREHSRERDRTRVYERDRDYGRDSNREHDRDRDYRSSQGGYPKHGVRDRYDNRTRQHGRAESYRSGPGEAFHPPQGKFTFRFDKPAGVQESYDNRDAHPDRPRADLNRPARSGWRGGRGGRAGTGFRGGRPAYKPKYASERELLTSNHPTGNEQILFDTRGGNTYRPLEELSDSDEAEMEISGDEAESEKLGEGVNKRARLTAKKSEVDNSEPKWSNPDPYSALPPTISDAQQKRKDPVALIRKARVQSASKDLASAPAEARDFISLDVDSGEESELEDADASEEQREVPGEAVARGPVLLPATQVHSLPAKPPQPKESAASAPDVVDLTGSSPTGILENCRRTHLPPAPAGAAAGAAKSRKVVASAVKSSAVTSSAGTSSSALGSRKRTHADEIKLPDHAVLKEFSGRSSAGNIMPEWRVDHRQNPSPWLKPTYPSNLHPSVRLHMEVMDFYEYVKPRAFEEHIRRQLVQSLKHFCRSRWPDAEVYPFGSFPSGLYLPTGDMDLVFMSDSYMASGVKKYGSRSHLHKFSAALLQCDAVNEGELAVIAGARVPLVKYIEAKTGLKMDMSFENRGGVDAVKTFVKWKEQYPVMPILVTLIKHFLTIRGLNEPANGGIGGMSVICLVVSMLQMMPEVQSGTMEPLHHTGDLLCRFFELYGKQFNYLDVAISLNPPKYIAKNAVHSFPYNNRDRLSIIDPNNNGNDIAGGSKNIRTIVASFADAHDKLLQTMVKHEQSTSGQVPGSILEVLVGGNYKTFQSQREHLRKLADNPSVTFDLEVKRSAKCSYPPYRTRGSLRARGASARARGRRQAQ